MKLLQTQNQTEKLLKLIVSIFFMLLFACSPNQKQAERDPENLHSLLEEIWNSEQGPITMRDSLIRIYGADSKEAAVYHNLYKKNHQLNEKKIRDILDESGWPSPKRSGPNGNFTIANVLQHSENDVRIKYLPMMRQAVKEKKLEARFLVRAEDRIATEAGKLQIYGGQMKYYPETKSFNLWPVFDPVNIDKRRAEIGLEPIADFLQRRFQFTWNLDEQIKRSEEFEKKRLNSM